MKRKLGAFKKRYVIENMPQIIEEEFSLDMDLE
jgi:hypothetical protein